MSSDGVCLFADVFLFTVQVILPKKLIGIVK